MKNTRNLVITEKEKYLTKDKALSASTMIYTKYEAPNTIKATGKNKWAIQLDEREMPLEKYKKLRGLLQKLEMEVYTTSKAHERRISRQQKHEKRMLEEAELNSKATEIIENRKALN